MEEKKSMGYITFKQFVYTINIRDIYFNNGKEIDDCMPIRIHFGSTRDWIYLGWDDFVTKHEVWEKLNKTLKPEILNSYVTDIKYNEDMNTLDVSIDANPIETIEEYNS